MLRHPNDLSSNQTYLEPLDLSWFKKELKYEPEMIQI